ncbi:MAG: hypothetical protein OXS29_17070 [bacterium]|nr:hypothetical protein [bacterium]MDE0290083.1 hypothetical protein [bacterium]MDE0437479.1 hypothetical protein [bacterium]
MAQLQLRPMGVGEIITASLTVYARRWRTLFAVAGVLILPYAVLYLALAEPPPAIPLDPTNDEAREFLSTMGPWLLIRLFILTIMLAAVIRTTMETYVGIESPWRQPAAAAISRMVALTVVAVLFWSAAVLGFTLFVLPGVFLIVCFSASVPVVMAEGVDPIAALGRSWRMTSGRRWHVLGVLLLSSALVVIGSLVVYLVVGPVLYRFWGSFGLSVASELVWIALQPFLGVALAVMYLDLRVRKEDLDTEWLSLQLSATSFDQ